MRRFLNWWRSKSIRFQLTTFVFLLIMVMSMGLLGIVYQVDKQERQRVAFQLTQMVANSMEEYLVDSLKGESRDFAEHLKAFPAIDVVEVMDQAGKRAFLYVHKNVDYDEYAPLIKQAARQPRYFHGAQDMVVYHPIYAKDSHEEIGRSVFIVDIKSLSSQLQHHALYLIVSLPLFLSIGGWLAYQISRIYNAPIERLTQHMQTMHLDALKPIRLPGQNGNIEIKMLYTGFNKLIANLKRTTERLKRQAIEDDLTGTLNRRGLQQAYQQIAQKFPNEWAVFVSINIDHFSVVNNDVGQQGGDTLLKQVAGTIKLALPDHAIIVRLYGDHFRVIIAPCSCEEAEQHVHMVHEALSHIETPAGRLSVTISWVCFQPKAWSYDLLYRVLENTLNQAREQGRGQILRYDPSEQESNRHEEDMRTLTQTRKALDGDGARFELYAQPIVPLSEDSVHQTGYEILIRLFEEDGAFITPDRFLSIAQRYNLMHEIDRWVVSQCIYQLAESNIAMDSFHKIHINLSGPSLHTERFVNSLKALLEKYKDFPWHKIEFELTETSAVSNFSQAKEFIEWCQQQGIGFALDDFGTGTASFEYLKLLPFDTVKIDGLFIRNMHKDPMDLAVIKHIREVTRLRGQETVAEFVETAEDVAILKEIGIDYGQGYYFSKPVPLSDILKK